MCFSTNQGPTQAQSIVLQGQQMVIQNQNGQPTLTVASNNLGMGMSQSNMQQLNIQPKPPSQSPIQTLNNQLYDKVPIISSTAANITTMAQVRLLI